MQTVDLNSDLGESYGRYLLGNDAEIIPMITSANVACGFHAGDPSVIRETLSLIKESGTTGLGAHPSYPDRQGFGRRFIDMTETEVYDMVIYQLAALDGFAKTMGLTMNHVKPHGALYNQTFEDYGLAEIIAKAVKDYNPKLKLMGLSKQNLVKAGEEAGLEVINEVFADRGYEADGTLVSRRKDGALITDPNEAVNRVIRMVKEGKVISIDGEDIDIIADSICVHGDGATALALVEKIITCLNEEGIQIKTI